MFNKAIEWKLIKTNPLVGMKLLKQVVREVKVIEGWEFQRLYNSANDNFKSILLFAYFTGCRRSEIRNLKWVNVNLQSGYVVIVDTKNSEERTIDLNSLLLRELLIFLQWIRVHYGLPVSLTKANPFEQVSLTKARHVLS